MSENSSKGMSIYSLRDLGRMINALLPLLFLFLINNYLLIPRLLLRRNVWLYVAVATLLAGAVALWNLPPSQPPPSLRDVELHGGGASIMIPSHPHSAIPMPFIHNFILAALVVGVNVAVAMVSRQIIFSIERERLISANTKCQLEHLKAQINPHFYMNMLNNIHGLVDSNPERAKDTIMDMSRLMQYMIYDGAKQSIPLADELKFIEDYLRVMKRRYSKSKVIISTEFPEREATHGITVPPLIFLVFIENAFKHGVDYRHPSFISMAIKIKEGGLAFECMNSMPIGKSRLVEAGGIGLENVRKRLSLLYGKEAMLNITDTPDNFMVTLFIPSYETAHS